MAKRVFSANKDWIVQQVDQLFTRTDESTEADDFQINEDSGVIRVTPTINEESFVAGMKACDQLHQINVGESKVIPLYNNAINDVD